MSVKIPMKVCVQDKKKVLNMDLIAAALPTVEANLLAFMQDSIVCFHPCICTLQINYLNRGFTGYFIKQ